MGQGKVWVDPGKVWVGQGSMTWALVEEVTDGMFAPAGHV